MTRIGLIIGAIAVAGVITVIAMTASRGTTTESANSGQPNTAAAEPTPTASTEVPTPEPTSAAVDAQEFAALARKVVDASVITRADLPRGWSVSTVEEYESDYQFSEECAFIDEGQFPGEIASAESEDFEGPNDELVGSFASVFADEEIALEAVASIDDFVEICRPELIESFDIALRDGFAEAGNDPRDLRSDWSFEKMSFPPLGDFTTAYRAKVDATAYGRTITMTMDLIFIQEGSMGGGLFYFHVAESRFDQPDTALVTQLAELILGKLEQANDRLEAEQGGGITARSN